MSSVHRNTSDLNHTTSCVFDRMRLLFTSVPVTTTFSGKSTPAFSSQHSTTSHQPVTVPEFIMKLMKLKFKALSLFLIANLLIGIQLVQAQVATLNPWTNVLHGTGNATGAYTVPAGSNNYRVLVVAVSSTTTTNLVSRTVTATYGGQTLTLATGDMTNLAARQHTAIYYLNEAGLDAATGNNLSVSFSGGIARMNDVWVTVLDYVNQNSPVTNSRNFNNTVAASSFAFATGLAVNANDQAVQVVNTVNSGNTTARTITYATNWTAVNQQTSTVTDGIRTGVANRAIPATNVAADVSTTTLDGAALASMTGVSFRSLTLYRSTASGNWNSTSTWQQSLDGGATWGAAANTPTDADGPVTIQIGHTVTVSANVSVDEVTVNSGGQIAVNSGVTLTIANSPTNVDLIVNGTLSNAGTITTTGVLSFGSGGTYIHAQNGGTVPTASWNASSTAQINNVTTTIPGGLAQTFGNFIWNSANTTAMTSAIAVSGNLTVQNGGSATFLLPTGTIPGTLNISGTANVLAATGTNRTTAVNGVFTMSAGTLTLSNGTAIGTLNLASGFNFTGGTITESSTGSGAINFAGNTLQTYTDGGTFANTIAITVNNGATLGFASASTTLSGSANFTLASGSTIEVTSTGGVSTAGATGHIQVSGTRTYNAGANYIYKGTAAQVTGSGLSTLNNLTINNSNGVTLSNAISVNGTVTLTSGALNVSASNYNISVGGNWVNNGGSLTGGTGKVIFTGATGTIGGTASTTFAGLTIDAASAYTLNTSSTAGTLVVGDSAVTGSSSLSLATGTTLTVNGDVYINRPGGGATNSLNVNAATLAVTGNLILSGNLSTATNRIAQLVITTGTATIGGNLVFQTNATATAATNLVTISSTGRINLAGSLSGTVGTLNCNSNSTFNYNGTNAQTIGFVSGNYGNLSINNTNASGATLGAAITATSVTGNIAVGDVTTGSLFSTNNFAVTLAATKDITVSAGSVMDAGTTSILAGTTANITINGTFRTSNTNGFSGTATTAIRNTNTPTLTLGANSVIEYASGSAQTVTGITYAGSVLLSGAGAKTTGASFTVGKTLTIGSSGLALSTFNANVNGNVVVNGAVTGTGAVIFTGGTATHALSGTGSFTNLTVNDATYHVNQTSDITVNGTLTLTNGVVISGSNKLIIPLTTTINRTNGSVFGILRRYIPNTTNPTILFPVGDTSNYTPVSIAFSGTVSGSGYLDVSTIAAVPPIASGLSQSRFVNRKWTIDNSGVTGFTSYDPTFTFTPEDLIGGPLAAQLQPRKLTSGTWTTPTIGTVTATSMQLSNLTSFSDFYIAEAEQASTSIQAENALTGNPPSEWDITGAGDLTIQGFATDMSVNKGGTVNFKVNVDDASNYTIKIYRLGYYNGNGARLWADLGTFTGVTQPNPITDLSLGLVDCGNWSVSASWTVPTNAVSGVYIAKLQKTVGGGASHIVFVVRDDAGNSDILFKTSDATWQAYNFYGGNSFYFGSTAYPDGHAVKISYNRPFISRGGGGGSGAGEDFIFNAEYPMIRFLERNGYNVSYTTDVDMERTSLQFTPSMHKVIMATGHDEYWSAAERTRITNARNAGVHLAFFSGNEVYWKTRWENSIDGNNTPTRTLVCYKEGTLGEKACGSKCDPFANIWTGLWRGGSEYPSADGNNPENSLTGQIGWGIGDFALKVPDTYKNYRFWRNTGVASLGSGQTATLADNTIGFEWDFDQPLYNSTYPAGRVALSYTDLNSKIHKITLYRHSNGALVFGAGTVQWSWGLDGTHDRTASTPDASMQQATINLFADMGVQPTTLQGGLVSATASNDLTAPVSTITTPTHNQNITTSTFVTISGTTVESGGGVIANVEVSVDGGTTWNPATGTTSWSYSWLPTVSGTYNIKVRAVDDLGNLEAVGTAPASNAITVNVTVTAPVCPCNLFPTDVPPTPVNQNLNDAQSIEAGMKFKSSVNGFITGIRFYKTKANGVYTVNLYDSATQVRLNFANVNTTATGWLNIDFGTPVAITANKVYVATFYSSAGDYSSTDNFFTTDYVNGYLTGLANATGKENGVYRLGSPGFPSSFYQASNFWVDPIFNTSVPPDVTAPLIVSHTPSTNAQLVPLNNSVIVTFNEAIDPLSVSSASFELRNSLGNLVSATISYNASNRTATLTPTSPLSYSATYSVTVKGGIAYTSVADISGNHLAADFSWSFSTQPTPPPPADQGNGGPVLVISSTSNPFSRYMVEILRAEGLNSFAARDISQVTADTLANYDVVLLGEFALSAGQVTLLTNYVNAGGNLIAFKPDAQLYGLLGITNAGGSLSNKYLLVNNLPGTPGDGIVGQTIQFHGTAANYNLNGATSLATLYSDANTATAFPAVTTRTVGVNGGLAVAYAYDLARSVVYTRQGNPAWAGTERDGQTTSIRSSDLFYGNAAGDPQPDWIDFNKIQIPQADEQQHLLANIITKATLHRKPLPRFWFLPRKLKAAVVMTGDDHAFNGTIGRFNNYLAYGNNSAQDVLDWKAVRGTSYIYPNTPITDSTAAAYQAMGFELALHLNTNCVAYDSTSLQGYFNTQMPQFTANFPSLNFPVTHRTHCITWSDWASKPKVEILHNIRLNTDYYYWPAAWIQNRPGMFTGSGMPMRFADVDGTILDNYQVTTQLTDEAQITYSTHIATLLDNAINKNYWGVFTANMHTDDSIPGSNSTTGSYAIVNAAVARNIPVVSARQMLTWLDGRNNSTYKNLSWSANALNFSIEVANGAYKLQAMVPVDLENGVLNNITQNGSPVTYTVETVKGLRYAFFDAATANYVANYDVDTIPPVISGIAAIPNIDGTATITWATNEIATSVIDYGTSQGSLNLNYTDGTLVTSHTVTLTGLTPGTTYYFRVTSSDGYGNDTTSPASPANPLTLVMPNNACFIDQLTADFNSGTTDAGTYVSTISDGELKLKPAASAEFTALPSPTEWGTYSWTAGGASVSSGKLIIDGAKINTQPSSTTFGPGTVVEFVATFRAIEGQAIGLGAGADGTDVGSILFGTTPWIIFGTANQRDYLKTRTYTGTGSSLDFDIPGSYFGSPHRYKIDWKTNSIDFYIDNVLVRSEVVTLSTPMRPVISDFFSSPPALDVDWIHVSPYASTGTYTSRVFDAGSLKNWENVLYSSELPAGTTLQLSYRRGNTPVPDGSWTAYESIPANNTVINKASRYIQYKAVLSTSDSKVTPLLNTIAFTCSNATSALPEVTLDPASQTHCEADTVVLVSNAQGSPNPDVQWQVSTNNGASWSDLSGETNDTLKFAPVFADNGKQYRAIWSNTAGNDTSAAATLTVNIKPAVTIAVSSPTICNGNPVSLSLASATGTAPFNFTIDGKTYTGITVGQTFATLNPLETSIWPNTALPVQANQNDGGATELGVKFRAAVAGKIKGIRFYKGTLNTGTHTGTLWNSSGTALATGTFTGETASGWQELRFATEVDIAANTTYVASYFSPNGIYAITTNGLANSYTNAAGSLTALASGTEGENGVFGTGAGFPASGADHNYWVDVIFEPTQLVPVTKQFTVTNLSDNNTCSVTGDSVTSVSVLVNPKPAGTLAAASAVNCNGSAISLIFTQTPGMNEGPYTLVINGQTYNNVISGTPFATGNNAVLNTGPFTLFDTTSVGGDPASEDVLSLELGMKFRPTVDGQITGIRFYKRAVSFGTHIGNLWTSTGTLLATATFTNETASGWQQVNFSSPVTVTAGTTYVASYFAEQGRYAYSANTFTDSVLNSSATLVGLKAGGANGGNGLYAYNGTSIFPDQVSPANPSYWVDVAFVPGSTVQSYNLTSITSAAGCTNTGSPLSTATVVIKQVSATITSTNVSCNSGSNGTVTVTGINGTAPYTYSLNSGSFQSSGSFTGLTAGTYTIQIKDATDCTKDTSVVITQPAAITTTVAITNVSCFGGTNGAVTLTPTGGTGAFTYSKDTGNTYQASATFSNLAAGNYLLRIKDANNCTKDTAITVTQPAAISATLAITNVACFNGATGAVTLTPAGGTGTYQYSIDTGTTYQTGATFSNLIAGNYLLRIKDANDCTKDTSITITQPTAISATITITNADCYGVANGSVVLAGSGGTGAFTYSKDTGNTYQSSGTFSSLAAGTYQFRIKDANNCTKDTVVIVTQPVQILGTLTTTASVICNESPVDLVFTQTSGAAGSPFTLVINGTTYNNITSGVPFASGNNAVMANGPFTIFDTTSVGGEPPVNDILNIEVGVKFKPEVNGQITGIRFYKRTVNTGTHVGNLWSATGTLLGTATFNNESASGWQQVNFSSPITVTAGTTYVASYFAPNGGYAYTANAFNDSVLNPSGTLTALKGTVGNVNGVYNYNNTSIFPTEGSVANANYHVDVVFVPFSGRALYNLTSITSAAGCTTTGNAISTASATVTQVSASITITNVLCNGATTGALSVTGQHGTAPYSYSLNNGPVQNTGSFTGLAAGSYTITIVDALDCAKDTTVTITQPTAISTTLALTNVACFGNATGAVTLTTTGGAGTFQYSIDTGTTYQSGNVFNNLVAGNYRIRIKDANNCTKDTAFTITQPTALSASLVITNADCYGVSNGSVVLTGTGGAGTYTYSKDTGNTYQSSGTFSSLAAGTYQFRIKDANNCTKDTTITITQPALITGTLASADAVTCNGNGISLVFTQTSGAASGPYTLVINGTTYNNVVSGVPFASGNNATIATGPFTLFNPADASGSTPSGDLLPVELGVKFKPSVNGRITGIRFYKGPGNSGTHTGSLWSTNGTLLATATFSGETASGWQEVSFNTPVEITKDTVYIASYYAPFGNYSFTANTFNDSVVNTSGTLTGLKAGGANGFNGLYNYGAGGVIPASGSGTNANYWVDVVFVPSSGTATYQLTSIATAAGCTTTGAPISTAVITIKQVNASITITNATCNGATNGAISVTGNSGTAPYTYRLNSGSFQSSGSFTGLAAGSYTIRIKDSTDCIKDTVITVSEPAAISTTATVTNASCFGSSTGSFTLSTIGGSGSYQYSIDTGNTYQSSNAFVNLAARSYLLRIKDVNNCTKDTVIIVGQPTAVSASVTLTNPNCNGATNGSVVLSGTGGTAGYTYSNNNGVSYQASGTFSGLGAGTFTFRIKDANNCTKDTTVTLTQPAVLSGTLSASSFCTGNQIYITYTAANGTGPFSLVINDSVYTNITSGIPFATGGVATNASESFFPTSSIGGEPTVIDNQAIETGVKFQSTVAGQITGIRFYKRAFNAGTHKGSLWAADGTLLAQATFVNETASGWQQVNFTTPVTITPGVTYIASYYSPFGSYAFTSNAYTNKDVYNANGTLKMLKASSTGGNGVFRYISGGGFPNQASAQDANYWVDVVFTNTAQTAKYTLTKITSASGCEATGAPISSVDVAMTGLSLSITKSVLTCLENTDGSFSITATGGTAPFQYSKDGGATFQASNSFTGLAAGTYSVRVKDATDCTKDTTVVIDVEKATWTGAVDTDWHTAGNWSTNQVPTSTTHVIIPVTANECIISSQDANAASVQVRTGATIRANNNRKLTIAGKCATLPAN